MASFKRSLVTPLGDSSSSSRGDFTNDSTNRLNEDAQEIMKNNLDLMRDVVMRIREDEDFARSIYEDCPRLQHQLELRPDLRPIFEDPKLVRINFEQVYREAGGVLPEDEVQESKMSKWKKTLACIVNHPLFKVLKFILLLKKIVGCIMGGGISMIRGCCQSMMCSSPPDLDALDGDADGDADGGDANPKNAANKEALNKAAEHMEKPEVQAQITELLENDPDGLAEAIENDPDLKALRDTNALCAELMSDPETMKILVDPENLRALGECPDLIEADFADPNWTPPDIEAGAELSAAAGETAATEVGQSAMDVAADQATDVEVGDANAERPGMSRGPSEFDLSAEFEPSEVDLDADVDGDADADGDLDEENPEEEEGEGEEEEEGGLMEDYELGENDNDVANKGGAKGKSASKSSNRQNQNQGQGRAAGFLGMVGAGFTDYIAGELVGVSMGDFMGGGDDLGGLEEAAEEAADNAESAADAGATAANMAENANTAAMALDMVGGEDMVDNLDALDNVEDAADHAEDTAADQQQQPQQQPAAGGGINGDEVLAGALIGGALAPGGVMIANDQRARGEGQEGENDDEEEEDEKEEKKKGKVRGWLGDLGSAVKTAAKESLLGAVLGDDLAEHLVEKQEEDKEEDEEKGEKDEEKKRKGMFGRKK